MRRPNARSQASDPGQASRMNASSKLQLRLPAARFFPFPRIPPPSQTQVRAGFWISLATAAGVTGIIYLFIISRSSGASKFGIIIDGGSTGTRIHVFGYRNGRGATPVLDFGLTAAMKVSPGLSSYSEDPEGVGESLVELLEFGKGRVPRELWGDTEIRLMATAGLRLLDATVAERILESCREVLRSSGFRFRDDWATMISGSDEGIYAWVAANYALGTLGSDPQKTTGIFELGGASAQVTFVSSEPLPPEFSHVLTFGETTYNLYSHSFLHLGQNVAYESLREMLNSGDPQTSADIQYAVFRDPCTPKGYLHRGESRKPSAGTLDSKAEYHHVAHACGNFSECRSTALMLLQKGKDECLYAQCHLGSAFIPKLQGRFLATENFFYTSKFFGLGSASFLSDLMMAGERFCEEDWLTLKKKYHALDEEDLVRYCFSSAYIVALLHDSLGIAVDDKRIEFASHVGDIPLDWALGAFIMHKATDQSPEQSNWINAIVGGDSLGLLSLFTVSIVLIYLALSVLRWRKAQLKIIYDLEKGRYITSRINR